MSRGLGYLYKRQVFKRSVEVIPGLIEFTLTPSITPFLDRALEKFKKAAFTAPPTIKNGSGEWLIAPLIETTHPLFFERVGQNAFDNLTAL